MQALSKQAPQLVRIHQSTGTAIFRSPSHTRAGRVHKTAVSLINHCCKCDCEAGEHGKLCHHVKSALSILDEQGIEIKEAYLA